MAFFVMVLFVLIGFRKKVAIGHEVLFFSFIMCKIIFCSNLRGLLEFIVKHRGYPKSESFLRLCSNSYASVLPFIIVSGSLLLLFYFSKERVFKNLPENKKFEKQFYSCVLFFFGLFVVLFVVELLYLFFSANISAGTMLVSGITIFILSAFILFMLADIGWVKERYRKAHFSSFVLFVALCVGSSFCFSPSVFMMKAVVKDVRYDLDMQQKMFDIKHALEALPLAADGIEASKLIGPGELADLLKSGKIRYKKIDGNNFSLNFDRKTDNATAEKAPIYSSAISKGSIYGLLNFKDGLVGTYKKEVKKK
jgi:hypothetical protein